MRLDEYIREKFNLSRSEAQKLNKEGLVLVNDEIKPNSYIVSREDDITIEEKDYSINAEKGEVPVIYEDEYFLIINKPNNLMVHPVGSIKSGTLYNYLIYNFPYLKDVPRGGIVHRLDKNTTGLMIIAKTEEAVYRFKEMFKNRSVEKLYMGIVEGRIIEDEGIIPLSLKRDPKNPLKMIVNSDGKESLTKFKVIKRFKNNTLVRFNLVTGRTHQIRCHMAYIDYPLLGDHLYGKNLPYGQYLVSYSLSFIHPFTNKNMHFEIEMPREFKDKIKELENE